MPIKLFPSLTKSNFFLVLALFKKNRFWAPFVTFQGPLLSVVQKKNWKLFFENSSHYILSEKHSESDYRPPTTHRISRKAIHIVFDFFLKPIFQGVITQLEIIEMS